MSNYADGTGENTHIILIQGNAPAATLLKGRFFYGMFTIDSVDDLNAQMKIIPLGKPLCAQELALTEHHSTSPVGSLLEEGSRPGQWVLSAAR